MNDKAHEKQLLKWIKDFSVPTRPTVMLRAMRAHSAFVPNPKEIRAIILRDMALAVTVLKGANTLLTGYDRRVDSIDRAIVLLGQERLRHVVQEFFLSARVARKESWMQRVRTQAVHVARIMGWLSQEMGGLSPSCRHGNLPVVAADEAYVAGLLHDCGQLVLLKHFADYAAFLTRRARAAGAEAGASWEALERARYTVDHATLGAMLCHAWQLPKPLAQLIETHHHIEAFAVGKPVKDRKFAVIHALLFFAQHIAGEVRVGEWEQGKDYFYRLFQIDDAQAEQLRYRAMVLFFPTEG